VPVANVGVPEQNIGAAERRLYATLIDARPTGWLGRDDMGFCLWRITRSREIYLQKWFPRGIKNMQRRNFVKAVVAATVAPTAFMGQSVPPPRPTGLPAPAPVPWMQGLNPAGGS
jgi:hypothetical protein